MGSTTDALNRAIEHAARPVGKTATTSGLGLAATLRVGIELGAILAALHQSARIHGKISPSAIAVVGGRTRLRPAASLGAPDPLFTAPGVRSLETAGIENDVYGLGATLGALALGRCPSRGPDGQLDIHRAGMDGELADVLDAATAPDPFQRFESVGQIVDELWRIAREGGYAVIRHPRTPAERTRQIHSVRAGANAVLLPTISRIAADSRHTEPGSLRMTPDIGRTATHSLGNGRDASRAASDGRRPELDTSPTDVPSRHPGQGSPRTDLGARPVASQGVAPMIQTASIRPRSWVPVPTVHGAVEEVHRGRRHLRPPRWLAPLAALLLIVAAIAVGSDFAGDLFDRPPAGGTSGGDYSGLTDPGDGSTSHSPLFGDRTISTDPVPLPTTTTEAAKVAVRERRSVVRVTVPATTPPLPTTAPPPTLAAAPIPPTTAPASTRSVPPTTAAPRPVTPTTQPVPATVAPNPTPPVTVDALVPHTGPVTTVDAVVHWTGPPTTIDAVVHP